jgi:hypothetical protein
MLGHSNLQKDHNSRHATAIAAGTIFRNITDIPQTTLVSGHGVRLRPPRGVNVFPVTTTSQIAKATNSSYTRIDDSTATYTLTFCVRRSIQKGRRRSLFSASIKPRATPAFVRSSEPLVCFSRRSPAYKFYLRFLRWGTSVKKGLEAGEHLRADHRTRRRRRC